MIQINIYLVISIIINLTFIMSKTHHFQLEEQASSTKMVLLVISSLLWKARPLLIDKIFSIDMPMNFSFLVNFSDLKIYLDSFIEEVIFYPRDPTILILFINYYNPDILDPASDEVVAKHI